MLIFVVCLEICWKHPWVACREFSCPQLLYMCMHACKSFCIVHVLACGQVQLDLHDVHGNFAKQTYVLGVC